TGSDWCGWCIKLDKEVFSKNEFKVFAKDHLVLFVADFPSRKKLPAATRAQNEQLAQTYGIEGYPTVLLLDAAGEVIARTGYQSGGAAAYVKHLKELLKQKPEKK
ncbi:MAG: thioredoxin family protein, partial [Lentisphaerae bacterium]|nr:thioredoxin family protein [Lentisphaerota bacterium]